MKIKSYKITYATGTMKRYKIVEAPNKKCAKEYLQRVFQYPITIYEVTQMIKM